MSICGFAARRRGAVMILALVVVLFAVLIAGAFGRQAVLGKSMAAKERQLSQAYYAAESGLAELRWHPDVHFPNPDAPLANSPADNFQTDRLGVPGSPDLEYQIQVIWKRSHVYEVQSLGYTPYATAMASVEADIRSIEDILTGKAFHMGPSTGSPTTVGVPGGGAGGPADVIHHYSGSDMSVYGTLWFKTDEDWVVLQDPSTYNIWEGKFFTWNSISELPDPEDFLGFPDYLVDKHDDLDPNAKFPFNIADAVRDSVLAKLPASDWTAPVFSSGDMLVGDTELDGKVVYNERLSNATVEGRGFLRLTAQDSDPDGDIYHTIKSLRLTGPLTIVTDSGLFIEQLGLYTKTANSATHVVEYPLTIVSERSVAMGNNSYDPYPEPLKPSKLENNTHFFFHDESIIWARHSLTIAGQIRPGEPTDYDLEDDLTPASFELVNYNGSGVDPAPAPKGKLILVSKEKWPSGKASNLSFHTMDTGGLVYAGSRLTIFRLRLTGVALLADPYRMRPSNDGDVMGLAQCYMIADPGSIFGGGFTDNLVVQTIRRIK